MARACERTAWKQTPWKQTPWKQAPSAAQVDSAYNGNDHRFVSHILITVKQDTTDAVKAAKRRLAQGYLDAAGSSKL